MGLGFLPVTVYKIFGVLDNLTTNFEVLFNIK